MASKDTDTHQQETCKKPEIIPAIPPPSCLQKSGGRAGETAAWALSVFEISQPLPITWRCSETVTLSSARWWAPTEARCPTCLSASAAREKPGLALCSQWSHQRSGRNCAPSPGPLQWPSSLRQAVQRQRGMSIEARRILLYEAVSLCGSIWASCVCRYLWCLSISGQQGA